MRSPFRVQHWAWATVIALILLAGLMAVPQVQAAVLRALRLGAVEIIVEPTPMTTPAPGTPGATEPGATLILSVLDLAGETTLDEARSRAVFPCICPLFPRI